ncbi:MAG: hypothetical protein VB088_08185 [Sphaerochaeta sp.]|nr:hypothetical protein [Sphaerochaeta sp.]
MTYVSGQYTSKQLMDNIFEVEDALTKEALAGVSLAITDTTKQADYKNRIEDLSLGRNTVLFDANNKPSVYCIYKPNEKARLDYLNNGGTHFTKSDGLHPAFIVNGSVVELLIGKYLAGRVGGTNHAVSLRGLDPANTINFDNSLSACIAKGTGHHMVTLAEWAYLSLLAIREGFQPRGNDGYGRSYADTTEKGIASYHYNSSGTNYTGRTRTGSGPLSWYLDGTPFSPADLRGNVLEWLAGYRTIDGEIQILQDNNAADGTKDQSAVSALWKAILQNGSLVAPETTDTYKWDYVNAAPASGSAPFLLNITKDNPPADATPYGAQTFSALAAKAGVTIHDLLRLLLIMPPLANSPLGTQYMRNVGERLGYAGGHWNYTSNAGLGFRLADYERSNALNALGFRPAFYRALTA